MGGHLNTFSVDPSVPFFGDAFCLNQVTVKDRWSVRRSSVGRRSIGRSDNPQSLGRSFREDVSRRSIGRSDSRRLVGRSFPDHLF